MYKDIEFGEDEYEVKHNPVDDLWFKTTFKNFID